MASPNDVPMGEVPPAPPTDNANEPKYGGYSRFELELEVRDTITLMNFECLPRCALGSRVH